MPNAPEVKAPCAQLKPNVRHLEATKACLARRGALLQGPALRGRRPYLVARSLGPCDAYGTEGDMVD